MHVGKAGGVRAIQELLRAYGNNSHGQYAVFAGQRRHGVRGEEDASRVKRGGRVEWGYICKHIPDREQSKPVSAGLARRAEDVISWRRRCSRCRRAV